MKKIIIFLLLLLVLTGCQLEQPQSKQPLDFSKINMGLEAEFALRNARQIYQQAKTAGQDLASGPCLSNELQGNPDYPQTLWVLDISHNPRQAIDDSPVNQCLAYLEDKADNFIELDPDGQLIKLYSPALSQDQLQYYNK